MASVAHAALLFSHKFCFGNSFKAKRALCPSHQNSSHVNLSEEQREQQPALIYIYFFLSDEAKLHQ